MVNGKGYKDGYVVFPRHLVPVLKKWRELNPTKEYVIPSNRDPTGALKTKSLSAQLAKYLERAGIRKIERCVIRKNGRAKPFANYSFHTFRHTRATFLLERGWDIRHIQRLLRHASIQCTQVYTQVSDQEIYRLINNETPIRKRSTSETQAAEAGQTPLETLQLRLVRQEIDLQTFRALRSELE